MDRTAVLEALARAESILHARRLFSQLGYVPDDLAGTDGSCVVGRWRGFDVIASGSATPRDTARALARKLAAASRRALAAAFGPAELAVAAPRIGAPGITPLLVIPRVQPPALALQLLCELSPRGGDDGLAHALRVAEILSTERAGERFFRRFRAALEQMATALPQQADVTERRTAALVTLTRVLFLYFVQAKGWLDGRSDYLRSLLDDALAKGRDFHRDVLHPLFFGTLNRPPAERSRRLRLGRIPYLNGGLFQPHPLERRLGGVRFPNDLWRETFDGLFERFRFCVREADEVTAVAPDMLGRVFERVMGDGERHATGTFYTPESVVRQMVDAAIATALAGVHGLDPDAAQRIVTGTVTRPVEVRAARRALRRLRVLDPAAGSGAFLLGALERLTEIHLLLEPRDATARCRLRREILRNNLFGVDLSPMAVRLAELRLWLALVADDPTNEIAAISPLPNLDGLLRQGDTLFDPVAAARALGTPEASVSRELRRSVAELRAAMYQARGSERARLARKLAAEERDLADRLIRHARDAAERASAELVALASGRDLFGNRSGLSTTQRQRYRLLRRHRVELRRAQRALRDGAVPFFSFDVHFPDVARAGFGIVLGNPPWVRAERLPPATRRTLASRFRWWRAAPTTGYGHLPDISVAFLERSLELVQPGGAVALLLPSKLASAGYAETARTQLVREATLTYLHRVPDRQAHAFGATTYPLALVVRKEPPAATHAVKLGFDGDAARIRQRALHAPGPWILVPDRTRDAIRRFLESGTPLARIAPPSLGVKTGADALFVGTTCGASGHTAQVQLDGGEYEIETSVLRPALHGRDVKPFRVGHTQVLIWAYQDGAPLDRLPPSAAAYFASRASRLGRRTDHAGGPPWTLFRVRAGLAGHRVVWPDIAPRPSAVALDETRLATAVPLNTCYIARLPDRAAALTVALILNTTWARAIAQVTADEARGGYRRINARVAGQMPVPAGSTRLALAAFGAAAHRNRHADQDQLDDVVADALGLSTTVRHLLRRVVAHPG